MNHTADECYSKHGLPPWMKQRTNYTANAIERNEDCNGENEEFSQAKIHNEKIFEVLNPEQLQQLINMIQNSKGKEQTVINAMGETSEQNPSKEGKSFWILDTGSTDHVACCISLFISYHKIKSVRVKLPNNYYVCVTHARTVFLSKNITCIMSCIFQILL